MERRAKELADGERERKHEEERWKNQENQLKPELELEKPRGKRSHQGVSEERPQDTNSTGSLDTKLLPQFKRGDIDTCFTGL